MAIKFKELKEYLEVGTNKIVDTYKSMTPGEDLDEADFKPHMMYDPKTGKAYKAEKPEDHERMSKMGYTHEKPKKESVELEEASKKQWDQAAAAISKIARMPIAKTYSKELKQMAVDIAQVGRINILQASQILARINKSYKSIKSADVLDLLNKELKSAGLMEAVSAAQQAAIAISKKERGEYKESVELDEARDDAKKYAAVSKQIRAVKDPIEGANLKKLAIIFDRLGKVSLINSGDLLNQMNAIIKGMDTDVREVVFGILKKNGLMESVVMEQPEEEKPMMKGQIEAMEHYLEGINEYLESTPDPEEWFQNKLTKAHSELSSLYSYSKGDDVEESTKAYGKSMRAVADKKKRDAMSSSDKDKLGKLAAMLDKERGKGK